MTAPTETKIIGFETKAKTKTLEFETKTKATLYIYLRKITTKQLQNLF